MKTLGRALAVALLALLLAVPAAAQSASAPNEPHHPGSAATTPGAKGGGAMPMGMPMMEMCRNMMGDMMAMPAMGAGAADPMERAAMVELRGELMKAMGVGMRKHGRRMHGMPAK